MLSPKRLVVGLAILGYGSVPAGTTACNYGPDEACAKRGQECGFVPCCEGLACDGATGKCVSAATLSSGPRSDTAQGPGQ